VAGDVTGLEARILVSRPRGFTLDISLSIPPEATVALLGPNGAGKSTAVGAIAGLLPIDQGRIALDDVVLDDPGEGVFVPPEQRRVGVVFQDYLLFPHLTVLENVSFGMRNRNLPREEASARSRRLLTSLGLEGLERSKPGDLSGGQAQRVALARALAVEPDLLLLDEPLAALDVTTRTELRHTLRDRLGSFRGPRLLITHDPTEAFLLADEILIIEEGGITQSGNADEIRLHPRTRYAADLAGSNLFAGVSSGGTVDVRGHSIQIAGEIPDGPVLLTIHPHAVSVHMRRPDGSPRNAWSTSVDRVEQLGARVRLRTGPPLPVTAELTEAARAELGLEAGSRVWVAIKATEIGVQRDSPSIGTDEVQPGA
jgi:molybdate transport system ATP-binding protein